MCPQRACPLTSDPTITSVEDVPSQMSSAVLQSWRASFSEGREGLPLPLPSLCHLPPSSALRSPHTRSGSTVGCRRRLMRDAASDAGAVFRFRYCARRSAESSGWSSERAGNHGDKWWSMGVTAVVRLVNGGLRQLASDYGGNRVVCRLLLTSFWSICSGSIFPLKDLCRSP